MRDKGKRVNPTGPIDAKIILVGEAPGKDESKTGIPFVGASGTILTQIMREAGVERAECYITNVIKYRPPNNDLSRLSEIGLNLEECEAEVRREISLLNPNVIVPLGNVALHAITGKGLKKGDKIANWRGSIIPSYPSIGGGVPVKTIPTLHPAFVMRVWENSPLLMFDFAKIKRESLFSGIKQVKKDYLIPLTFEKTMDSLHNLGDATALAIDIETYKYTNIIKCIGFSRKSHSALCIPIMERGKSRWSVQEESKIWKVIRELLIAPQIRKIIQNMDFEMEMLFPYVGEIYPVYMDTMIASHLYLPELRKSLALQTSIYTDMPYYKTEAHDANYDPVALYQYNMKDCDVTFQIYEYLEERLKEDDLHNFLHGFQMPLGRMLWRASHIGIKVDQERVGEYKKEAEIELKRLESLLEKDLGYLPDINSPTKMCKLLYQEMGYPPQWKLSKTVTGEKKQTKTVDEKALQKLNKSFPNPMFDLILGIREQRKLLSTYLTKFWDEDGRCRTEFKITGAKTGRLSSTQNIRGTGLNMQNVMKWFRDVFVSDEGFVMLRFDLSQSDSRFVAYLSQDENMMNSFEEGRDIHSTVGSMLYDKDYEDCGKDTPERQDGKKTGHSANYHISPLRLQDETGMPLKKCKSLLERYYIKFNLTPWWQGIIDQLKENRTLITALGRRRIFYGRWPKWKEEEEYKGDLFKAAYANEPQSLTNDHINLCGVRIFHRLPPSSTILIQCHDELVLQCKEEDEERVKEIVREELNQPIKIKGRDIIIPADIEVGKNWKMV